MSSINLEYNLIYSIEQGVFSSLPDLKVVHLEYNALTDVSSVNGPSLSAIFLDGNIPLHQQQNQVKIIGVYVRLTSVTS